ncbi:MAG: permease-like cell division protein FtsX [Bacteroidia bacterium]|nr:permease-like cell division protein FtsX [Bacteroidia bacterium]
MFRNSGFVLVFSLSLLIFLILLLSWSLINSAHLSRSIRENLGFQIYLKDSIPGPQLEEIQRELDRSSYTRHWIMVEKESAARELKEKLGEDFIGFLGYNPLLNMLDVKVKAEYATPDSLEAITSVFRNNPAVHEVVYQRDVVDKINKNMKTIFYLISIFAASLLIVALFLMHNTIRLSLYSQRFIIHTMYLVGATRLYITKPFVIRSILQGMLAGGAGIFLFVLVYFAALQRFPELSELGGPGELYLLMVATLLFSIIITAAGTFLSAFRLVNLKSAELYQ